MGQMGAPKTCPNCGKVGTIGVEFYKTAAYCKPCHSEKNRVSRQAPHRKAKQNAYNKEWQRQHPERRRAWMNEWRAKKRGQKARIVKEGAFSPQNLASRKD